MRAPSAASGSSRLVDRRRQDTWRGSGSEEKQVQSLYGDWSARLIAYGAIFIIVLCYAVISDMIIGVSKDTVTYGCFAITTLLLIAAPLIYARIRSARRARARKRFTTKAGGIEWFNELFSDQCAVQPKNEKEMTRLMQGSETLRSKAAADAAWSFRGVRSDGVHEEIFAGRA